MRGQGIDPEIKPLVSLLYKVGLVPHGSCWGHPEDSEPDPERNNTTSHGDVLCCKGFVSCNVKDLETFERFLASITDHRIALWDCFEMTWGQPTRAAMRVGVQKYDTGKVARYASVYIKSYGYTAIQLVKEHKDQYDRLVRAIENFLAYVDPSQHVAK